MVAVPRGLLPAHVPLPSCRYPTCAPSVSGWSAVNATHNRRLVLRDWAVASALAVAAWYLRRPGLDPSSLWLDDAWPALVHRADTFGDMSLVAVTAPGFTFGLKAWLAAVGFSELAAQVPALLFGVVTPPAAYLVARRRGFSVAGAVIAGVLLVVSTTHGVYSTRVKQYTFDGALSLAILASAWTIIDQGASGRRWRTLLGVAIAATALSGTVAPVAAGAFCAAIAAAGFSHRGGWKGGLLSASVYGTFGVAWWCLVLKPSIPAALTDYWRDFYLSTDSLGAYVHGLGDALVGLIDGFAFAPQWLAVAGLAVAVVTAAYRRWSLVALLIGPVVVAIGLASVELLPLGTGRTDIFLYPEIALLAAAGFESIRRWAPRSFAVGALVGIVAILALAPGVTSYPEEDVRPLVDLVEDRLPEDPVIVYEATRWAYALYTSYPISFRTSDSTAVGFDVDIGADHVAILGQHRSNPERYAPELAALTNGHQAVWLIATHWRADLEVIEAQFEDLGFVVAERHKRAGALLIAWERTSTP